MSAAAHRDHGGLRRGDIVVAADGTPIRSAVRLRNKLGLTRVGERVQLAVKRKGVVHNVSVEVAPRGETTETIPINRQPHPRAGGLPE